jgi:hypothetical protein
MAAGLGFKDFTTGEVLTAADVDGYLMQGVWVFASAAARDAAVTSPQEGNFAYLKDTNVTTYYTGSAWANLDTTGMTNPMTTTGDTIYSSSGSTPARLGIGSTGNVLTVSGGVPVWSAPAGGGGMTLISTTTLTGASVLISSIPADYVHLQLIIKDYLPDTDDDQIAMRLNDDSNNRYYSNNLGSNTVGQTFSTSYATPFNVGNDNAVAASLVVINIFDYKNTDTWKYWNATGITVNATTTTSVNIISRQGAYNQTGAISSIRLLGLAGNFTSGSVLLYGVK